MLARPGRQSCAGAKTPDCSRRDGWPGPAGTEQGSRLSGLSLAPRLVAGGRLWGQTALALGPNFTAEEPLASAKSLSFADLGFHAEDSKSSSFTGLL